MKKLLTWGVKTSLLFVFVFVFAALEATAANQVLQGTYIDVISGIGTTIPAGALTPIGNAVTVSCPGTSGTCTIQGDMWVTNGGGNTTGNELEVCLFVDGNRVDPYCYGYAGMTPSDGTYFVVSSSQSLSGLALGSHTVQTYFWSQKGCEVTYRHTTYTVYKP